MKDIIDFLIENAKTKHWKVEQINIKDLPQERSFINHIHMNDIPADISYSDLYFKDDGYAYCKKDDDTLWCIIPNYPQVEAANVL